MPKKIAIFEDGNGFGGAVFALLENLRHLSFNKDYEFIIFHSLNDPRFDIFTEETQCQLKYNPVKNWTLNNKYLDTIFKRFNLYLLINSINSYCLLHHYKADLIYTNNDIECNLHAIIASKLLKLPIISHERDVPSFWSKTTKLLYSSISVLIVISQATKLAVIKQGFPESNIIKIVDGIDTQRLIRNSTLIDTSSIKQHYQLPLDKKIILMIGMITHWKGQHIALQAIKKIKVQRSDLYFVFVGEKPAGDKTNYLNNLHNYIIENDLQTIISMLGYSKMIAPLINASDLVIHTSITPEPFGRVIVESMTLKKPVIATNIGGPCEIIHNEKTGFLIEPNNSTALANKIIEVINTPEQSKTIARAAQKYALNHYDSKMVAFKIEKLLHLYTGH